MFISTSFAVIPVISVCSLWSAPAATVNKENLKNRTYVSQNVKAWRL